MVKNPFLNLFGGMTQWLYQRFSAISIYYLLLLFSMMIQIIFLLLFLLEI